ncbi:hypothetical protein BH23PAT2_BH23PAT2_08860 [soil metagenome]
MAIHLNPRFWETYLYSSLKYYRDGGEPVWLPADTPCDNNRAERDLRGLVLKRKRSFGSKSEKGAQALATVLSICTTSWRTNQNSYFSTLAALA